MNRALRKGSTSMMEPVEFVRQNLLDLDLIQCGSEACLPGHSFGPAVRDHYLIHFALSGKGIFQTERRTWALHEGDGFLIFPHDVTFYQADVQDPWQYAWVGFQGTKADTWLHQAGLTVENPVFSARDDYIRQCFRQMIGAGTMGAGRELRLLGILYLFLSELAEMAGPERGASGKPNRKEEYVKKALDYFRMHYARPIGVSDAAAHVGLDRSYFSEVFREVAGQPPRDFLIRLRMEKACQFLRNPGLSIGDIARSVGYDDPLLFSKVFRKHLGASPSAFRQSAFPASGSPAFD